MAAAPDRVMVVVAPAATAADSPVWSVKVTPVDASHAPPLSDVIAPVRVTVVTRTPNDSGS